MWFGDRRGEAGVGTSIIFIALVLVSGAASSIVLDTTSESSEQAEDIVLESLNSIAKGAVVRDVVGVVDLERGRVTSLEVLISLQPGSPAINASDIVVHLVTPHENSYLSCDDQSGFTIKPIQGAGSVIKRGDLTLLCLELQNGLSPRDELTMTILVSNGATAVEKITIGDAISRRFIQL